MTTSCASTVARSAAAASSASRSSSRMRLERAGCPRRARCSLVGDGCDERLAPAVSLLQLGRCCARSALRARARLLRAGALLRRRQPHARRARRATHALRPPARRAQLTVRARRPAVAARRRARSSATRCSLCEPRDRSFGLRASGLERGALLFGAPSLERDDVRLARQATRVFVRRGRAARRAPTIAFSCACSSACSTAIALVASAMRSSRLRDVGRQSRQQLAIAADALAQLLDLATGGQDAARLDLRAAGHEMRPAEDVALDRRDRRGRLARERHRLLEASRRRTPRE